MTVLEALAVLEAATLECRQRDIDTQEVRDALDLLEPYVPPEWVAPQFCHHVHTDGRRGWELQGQQ